MNQKLIHHGFLESCEFFKNNVALISDSERVTYSELGNKALTIAQSIRFYLKNKSNKPIVVFLEKGLYQVFSVLGVSVSGHSFVPVNVNWPKLRIQSIFSKLDPDIIIASRSSIQKSIADKELFFRNKVLFLEDILQSSIESKCENNFKKVDDLAYIIFTSGTTGEPKGVAIRHCSAVNTIDDINFRFNVNQNDSVFALSDLTFDLSIYDIFGLLSCGGSVLIPNSEQIKDPAYWIKLLSQQRVTIWNSAPMFMQMLVSYIENVKGEELIKNVEKISDNLRLVMLSGDKIPIKLPQKIKSIFKNAAVVSLGGATEASIWSIMFNIEEIDPNWTSIPYGKALRNQSIHILDENMKEIGIEEIGEIYIGGIGLAACYYNDNELTQTKFKKHEKFGRVYATGDLGRLMQDGNIEILGRKDNQIKLNGYRIELLEIEKVFLDQFKIKNIHLLKHKYNSNVEILLAFLVNYTDKFNVNEIKLHLKNFIPSYSIPSRIVFVDTLPVTENGKVDENALRKLANEDETLNKYDQQESSEIHKKIIDIIALSLDKPKINPNLDFYDIGGNSLAAVKICADIFSNFNITIPSTMIFNTKTITEFSEIVSGKLDNL